MCTEIRFKDTYTIVAMPVLPKAVTSVPLEVF